MVASAKRLGWTVIDASHMVTDEGVSLDLRSDPPVVVVRCVHESVKRWRWAKVATKHSQLNANTQLVQFDSVQRVLGAKKFKDHSVEMTRNIQGGLRSALANRQWPQSRCFNAGFVPRN
jgi:hypothetical protein